MARIESRLVRPWRRPGLRHPCSLTGWLECRNNTVAVATATDTTVPMIPPRPGRPELSNDNGRGDHGGGELANHRTHLMVTKESFRLQLLPIKLWWKYNSRETKGKLMVFFVLMYLNSIRADHHDTNYHINRGEESNRCSKVFQRGSDCSQAGRGNGRLSSYCNTFTIYVRVDPLTDLQNSLAPNLHVDSLGLLRPLEYIGHFCCTRIVNFPK